jgi:putative transposase
MAKYNTIIYQILPFAHIGHLKELFRENKTDRYVKRFYSKFLFITLVYGMLSGKKSLRLLEKSLNPQTAFRRSIGMPAIHRNTISLALAERPAEVFQKHFYWLLNRWESKCFIHRKCGGGIVSVDATVIKMSKILGEWAKFEKSVNGFKLHIIFDNTLDIPQFCQLSLGKEQELSIAKGWVKKFPKGRILVFDRAYFSWEFLHKLDKAGFKFVIPIKSNVVYDVECEVPVAMLPDDVAADQIVSFTSKQAKKFKHDYRVVEYRDPQSEELWFYVTNMMDEDAELIVEIYRQRWRIELFFKWIKQNLQIKSFWGSSRNAVEIQIWIALIVYLILRYLSLHSRMDAMNQSPYYFYNVLRDSLFERVNLFVFYQLTIT